jgi:hypothetical protein
MKCLYQSCDCRYVDTSGMSQTKPCHECELYDPHDVRVSDGCIGRTGVLAVIIILILLAL